MDDFAAWYRREHPRVLATCTALTGELDAALDATDEGFARALERWPRVAAMASPGGWVQVVALNHLRRVLRRSGQERLQTLRSRPYDSAAAEGVPDPDLWVEVAALPPRQRTAVVLRYVHDLPEAEIGALMGITRGGVASTLAAAQGNLRRRIDVTGAPEGRLARQPIKRETHR